MALIAYDFLVQGHWIGYFSFCCDRVPYRSNFTGEGFLLAYSSKGYGSWWWGKRGAGAERAGV